MLTGIQIVRIAAKVGRSPKTVIRVYRGGGNAYSRASVAEAALALGYPSPPGDTIGKRDSEARFPIDGGPIT